MADLQKIKVYYKWIQSLIPQMTNETRNLMDIYSKLKTSYLKKINGLNICIDDMCYLLDQTTNDVIKKKILNHIYKYNLIIINLEIKLDKINNIELDEFNKIIKNNTIKLFKIDAEIKQLKKISNNEILFKNVLECDDKIHELFLKNYNFQQKIITLFD